jgi:hypothetical protein
MRRRAEMELTVCQAIRSEGTQEATHREDALPKDDDVHIQRLQIGRAEIILLETPEADEIIIPEKLDLLACLLHLDIFSCQGMDVEHLDTQRFASET